jgi:hypothetical protein
MVFVLLISGYSLSCPQMRHRTSCRISIVIIAPVPDIANSKSDPFPERDLVCPYAYASPLHHWIAGLQGSVELLPTAELVLASMLITEGINLSEETGKEVSAEEIQTLSTSAALAL